MDRETPYSEEEILLFAIVGSATNVIQHFYDSLIDWSLHMKQEQASGANKQWAGNSPSQPISSSQANYIINVRGYILQGAKLACCMLRVLCTLQSAQISEYSASSSIENHQSSHSHAFAWSVTIKSSKTAKAYNDEHAEPRRHSEFEWKFMNLICLNVRWKRRQNDSFYILNVMS